jgi:hypothetical protein
VFPNFCQKNNIIKQTLIVYKVPPGDMFANNYGRGHMKPSHQVSYDMRLPPNKKIPVNNDQYVQGTPWTLEDDLRSGGLLCFTTQRTSVRTELADSMVTLGEPRGG